MHKIDKNICRIRNSVSHHNNLLFEDKQYIGKNPNIDKSNLKYKSMYLDEEELDYIKLNYNFNSLRLILDLIINVNHFISLHECTSQKKRIVFEEFYEYFNSSLYYYSKLQGKDWADKYYSCIDKQMEFLGLKCLDKKVENDLSDK